MGKQYIRKGISFADFQRLRTKYEYVVLSTIANVLNFLADLPQICKGNFSMDQPQVLKLPKRLQTLISAPPATNGLKFIRLPQKYLKVSVCTDILLAVNRDVSSQLGIFAMAGDNKTGFHEYYSVHIKQEQAYM